MDAQLQEIIELQREQNLLLKKHLTRIRFSLGALLLLTTLTGVGLGIGVYLIRPVSRPVIMPPAPAASPYLRLYDTPPSKVEKPPVG